MGDNLDEINLSDEEELITAHKVLENFENAWINERFAPEILPNETEMLDLILGQISHMEENMKSLDKNDFRYIAHKMELERIQYIVASYLRSRISKIEHCTKYILDQEANRSPEDKRLSVEEHKFATGYYNSIEKYFNQVALQYMPNMQRSDSDSRIIQPNLMSHVFIKATKTVPAVIVGPEDEEVDLVEGSQHILPYRLISDLLLKGFVQLI